LKIASSQISKRLMQIIPNSTNSTTQKPWTLQILMTRRKIQVGHGNPKRGDKEGLEHLTSHTHRGIKENQPRDYRNIIQKNIPSTLCMMLTWNTPTLGPQLCFYPTLSVPTHSITFNCHKLGFNSHGEKNYNTSVLSPRIDNVFCLFDERLECPGNLILWSLLIIKYIVGCNIDKDESYRGLWFHERRGWRG